MFLYLCVQSLTMAGCHYRMGKELRRTNPPLFNQTYIDAGDGPCVVLLHGLFDGRLRLCGEMPLQTLAMLTVEIVQV